MFLRNKKAFTLIELLVVIAIIGVLSTMAIIALGNARTKARDARRVADLKQISTALELYYNDNSSYPTIITPGQSLRSPDGNTTYMGSIPSNPTPRNDGNCGNVDYSYQSSLTGTNYSLGSCLGSGSGNMSAGAFFTSNNSGPLACGQATVIDIDGNTYNTVQIGTQCWMKSSLRTRSKPNGTAMTNSTADNSVTHSERSCPGNGVGTTVPGTEADCTTYGALYEWAVAMNGSILEGAQGICPLGWHIPSDAEWYVLENYLKDNGQTCDANRIGSYDCTAAGTKLKPGGSSGYNGEFGGDRWVVGNYFAYRDSYAVIWSSSRYDSSTAWHRELYSGNAGVIRARNGLTFAFSVRCLKD